MPPVVGALGAIGTAIAASPILTFAAQIGASLVLSAVAQRLQRRPASFEQQTSIRAPVVPRDMVYGTVRKGGTMIFAHVTQGDATEFGRSDHLHLIFAVAGHQIQGIEKIYFDGELAWNIHTGATDRYADSIVAETRRGTPDQSAFAVPFLPADLWTPAHRCRGVALAYLRLRGNAEDFPNGIPNITFLVHGRDTIFDPRTGLFGFSRNSALCVADYMSSRQYGLALPYGVEGGIDTAPLIEAANVCDEAVARPGGGTEPRYTTDGVISSAAQPKETIEGLLTAMGGKVIYSGDRWAVQAAAYRNPTVALGPGDIREAGITVQTRRSRADNFNAVRGQFVSPERDWQPDDFPTVRSSVYLGEDQGLDAWRDLSLPFTVSAATAQRLAKIELERVRRQQVIQVSGMLAAWRAKVGDTVSLTYPRWGYSAKPFEVRKVTLRIDGGALVPDLTLAEVSPLQYDWDASEEQIYAAAPQTNLPDPFAVGAPGVPQVTEALFETRSGTVEVKASLTWGASAGPFLDFYEVQSRRLASADGVATGEAFATLVRTSLTNAEQFNVSPGQWEWRVRAVNTLGRQSGWATTAGAVLGFSAPPVALTAVTIQTNGNTAILKWALPSDADVRVGGRVQIRHSASASPSWANSVSMDEVPGSSTTATVPLKPGTYLLRPVDSSGIFGPVTMVATKGASWVPFANVTVINEHPTWLGEKANVQIEGTSIRLTDVSAQGVYSFNGALDLGLERAVRLRSEIDVSAITLNATIDDRLDLIDTWPDFDGIDGADTDVIVEVRTTDDNPAGSPVWTDWTRLDATEEAFRGAQFRARLISNSADYNPLVAALSIRVDEAS